jgi:hypothetical protein
VSALDAVTAAHRAGDLPVALNVEEGLVHLPKHLRALLVQQPFPTAPSRGRSRRRRRDARWFHRGHWLHTRIGTPQLGITGGKPLGNFLSAHKSAGFCRLPSSTVQPVLERIGDPPTRFHVGADTEAPTDVERHQGECHASVAKCSKGFPDLGAGNGQQVEGLLFASKGNAEGFDQFVGAWVHG